MFRTIKLKMPYISTPVETDTQFRDAVQIVLTTILASFNKNTIKNIQENEGRIKIAISNCKNSKGYSIRIIEINNSGEKDKKKSIENTI